VLAMLEAPGTTTGGAQALKKPAADLPLFSVMPKEPEYKPSAVEDALTLIDPYGMSPREALEALYALKNKLENG